MNHQLPSLKRLAVFSLLPIMFVLPGCGGGDSSGTSASADTSATESAAGWARRSPSTSSWRLVPVNGTTSSSGTTNSTYSLVTTVTGSGSVSSSPSGINCGSDTICTAYFNAKTVVTLTAAPASGYVFAGWSGACTGTSTCTVTMSTSTTALASFTQLPAPQPTGSTTTTGGSTGTSTGTVIPTTSSGTTYHIRVDGGSADQCNGRYNAAYPGTGSNQNCAWKNPMIALPPAGGGTVRIAGGDTLLIHPGQYRIGLGAPGAESCSQYWPWDCSMQPVPSGPDASRPTRIVGEGFDSTCSAPPQLYGVERVGQVLSLQSTQNATLACMEITDHSPCVEFHGGPNPTSLTCNRGSYPYGDWAGVGLYAADAVNILIKDLNIHGLANRGVMAGRLRDWNVTNLRIAGNGWAGWDGDISGGNSAVSSSNSGTMRFSKWVVEWNGCAETYPGNQPTGCWAQSAGGYGDGVGTGSTAGDWIIEDSIFRFNTSDGLDLLYHTASGSITLNRVWAEGNAGNQIKVSGAASISNSVVIGTCGSFHGQSFTLQVDDCRAAGDTVAAATNAAGQVIALTNNTIVSEGNVVVLTGGPAGSTLRLRNNILVGLPFFIDPTQQSADTYVDASAITVDEAYSLKQNLRHADCTTPNVICTSNAGLTSTTRTSVNPALTSTSPALNSGVSGVNASATDYYRNPRVVGSSIDRGAAEKQ